MGLETGNEERGDGQDMRREDDAARRNDGIGWRRSIFVGFSMSGNFKRPD
jgi:hypothetical protein